MSYHLGIFFKFLTKEIDNNNIKMKIFSYSLAVSMLLYRRVDFSSSRVCKIYVNSFWVHNITENPSMDVRFINLPLYTHVFRKKTNTFMNALLNIIIEFVLRLCVQNAIPSRVSLFYCRGFVWIIYNSLIFCEKNYVQGSFSINLPLLCRHKVYIMYRYRYSICGSLGEGNQVTFAPTSNSQRLFYRV